MRRSGFLALATLSLIAPSATPNHGPEPFAPMAFLVGSCWQGTFPDGKATDQHCFEWMYDRKFVRDRHTVKGGAPYGGETIYAWDPAQKQVVFSYYNSEGQVMQGRVEVRPEGLVFPTKMTGPGGETDLKAVWTRVGDSGYRIWQGRREGSDWKELWTMEMKRRAP